MVFFFHKLLTLKPKKAKKNIVVAFFQDYLRPLKLKCENWDKFKNKNYLNENWKYFQDSRHDFLLSLLHILYIIFHFLLVSLIFHQLHVYGISVKKRPSCIYLQLVLHIEYALVMLFIIILLGVPHLRKQGNNNNNSYNQRWANSAKHPTTYGLLWNLWLLIIYILFCI